MFMPQHSSVILIKLSMRLKYLASVEPAQMSKKQTISNLLANNGDIYWWFGGMGNIQTKASSSLRSESNLVQNYHSGWLPHQGVVMKERLNPQTKALK